MYIIIKGVVVPIMMKNTDEIINEIRNLKLEFENHGCSYQSFLSFLINNACFLIENKNISNRIHFLYNNKEFKKSALAPERQRSVSRCG